MAKKILLIPIALTIVCLSIGCTVESKEEQEWDELSKLRRLWMPLLTISRNATQTDSSTTCTTSEDSRFTGKVVDSLTNTALSLVEVSTYPTSTTVTTGSDGSYTIDQSICNNQEYTILYNKYGYKEKSIKQTARPNEYDTGTVTLTRDTDTYTFINILVRGSDNSPLAGATIGYAGGGTTVSTGTTNSVGIYSLPVLKTSVSQVLTISVSEYKTASVLYNVSSGSCSSQANGKFTCAQDSIVVKLKK